VQEYYRAHDNLNLFYRYFCRTAWMVPTSGMTSLVGIVEVVKEAT